METNRCAYCHKLQRADAQACSRCGHVFVQKRSRPSTREWTQPSIPPASPHRAGHYSGLHPEDQPYQSNKIAIQHPIPHDSENWRSSLPEPEHIILPVTDPGILQRVPILEHYDEGSAAELPVIEFYGRQRWHLPRPAIPVLLAISCIFFVLASSILVVVLVRKSTPTTMAQLTASPSTLSTNDTLTLSGSGFNTHNTIVFTYDQDKRLLDADNHPLTTHAVGRGTFSLQLLIPRDWGLGPHII